MDTKQFNSMSRKHRALYHHCLEIAMAIDEFYSDEARKQNSGGIQDHCKDRIESNLDWILKELDR